MTPRIDRATAKADVLAVLAREPDASIRRVVELAGYSRHVVEPILHELAAAGDYRVVQCRRPKAPEIPDHLRGLGTTALARAMRVSVRTAQRRRNPRAAAE